MDYESAGIEAVAVFVNFWLILSPTKYTHFDE